MSALPRTEPGPPPLRLVAGDGNTGETRRLTRASAWTVASVVAMSALRLGSQMSLSYLCLPEHFGVVALMRTFLTFVEMCSDMGIRGAVQYHARGEERSFLSTAASVQLVRGLGMWLVTCAVAYPVAAFYNQPLLLWLLPLAGFESVSNGCLSVRVYVEERRLKLAMPVMLEVFALVVSIATSILWAWIQPGVLALAAGPLVGGFARAVFSHWHYRAERVPLGWDKGLARELFGYTRWILGGTMVGFVAQQFHVLYLSKVLPMALLGVYQVAWNFVSQASKPMTALANRVVIPHFAEFNRRSAAEHDRAVRASLGRFLPACVAACVASGIFAPALFGIFYADKYAGGGPLGWQFAIVVWFMILQHVPRSALMSLGASREVAGMALWNAVLTVIGIVAGYALSGGSILGAILGNALGNLAGCASGWRSMRARGLHVGRAMVLYSLWFLLLLASGVSAAQELVHMDWFSARVASLVVTGALGVPLALWVWRSTLGARRVPVA